MIVRTWTGVVHAERVADYLAYVRATGFEEYGRTPGCRQALLLTRAVDDERAEVVALSTWDDEESLRAFTGPDVTAMVLYPEDRDFLLAEPTLVHHDTAAVLPGQDGTRPREIAAAFSGHRFRDAYDSLSPDVRWTAVGEGTITGRQAVVDAYEATLAELSTGTAEFLRFAVVDGTDSVAVDAVGRYVSADGSVSVVSSCDVYAFADGAITSITSYAVELDPSES